MTSATTLVEGDWQRDGVSRFLEPTIIVPPSGGPEFEWVGAVACSPLSSLTLTHADSTHRGALRHST